MRVNLHLNVIAVVGWDYVCGTGTLTDPLSIPQMIGLLAGPIDFFSAPKRWKSLESGCLFVFVAAHKIYMSSLFRISDSNARFTDSAIIRNVTTTHNGELVGHLGLCLQTGFDEFKNWKLSQRREACVFTVRSCQFHVQLVTGDRLLSAVRDIFCDSFPSTLVSNTYDI